MRGCECASEDWQGRVCVCYGLSSHWDLCLQRQHVQLHWRDQANVTPVEGEKKRERERCCQGNMKNVHASQLHTISNEHLCVLERSTHRQVFTWNGWSVPIADYTTDSTYGLVPFQGGQKSCLRFMYKTSSCSSVSQSDPDKTTSDKRGRKAVTVTHHVQIWWRQWLIHEHRRT